MPCGSAVTRGDRLWRQPRLIAMDWMAWHQDRRLLAAAVVVGGRAMLGQATVFSHSSLEVALG
jgi:hypothetical protein